MTDDRSRKPPAAGPSGERPPWRKPGKSVPSSQDEETTDQAPQPSPVGEGTLIQPAAQAGDFPEVPGVTFTREVGRGGMGIVYEGKQGYLDRRVAVKLLAGSSQGTEFTRRFQREAKLLAALSHPHIVACYQAGVAPDGRCYLAMEFIDGPDLASWIEKHGPLAPAQAVSLCKDVASALAHAHRSGIIHRDIKPANVLLQRDAHAATTTAFPWRSKLADLGLARPEAKGKTAIELTSEGLTVQGTVMGSPPTMAPEQFDAPDQVDFRTDIYGLGCVLFHCLTGKLAFPQSSLTGLIAAKTRGDPPDPREMRADLSKELAQLVRDMIAPAREDRPQSYEELLRRLEGPFPAPATKRRTPLVLGAGALALGMAFVGWRLASGPPVEPAPPRPAGEAPRLELEAPPGSAGNEWFVKSLPVPLSGRVLANARDLKPDSLNVDGKPVSFDAEGRFTIASFAPAKGGEGSHSVRIEVVDAWQRQDVRDLTLIVDGTAPVLSWRKPVGVKEPRAGVWLTRSDTIDLELEVIEPHDPRASAWRGSGSARSEDLGAAAIGADDRFTWSRIELALGDNAFQAEAEDRLGNASLPLELRVKRTYDLSLNSPAIEDGAVRAGAGAAGVELQVHALTALKSVHAEMEGAAPVAAEQDGSDPLRFDLSLPLPAEGERFEVTLSGLDDEEDVLASSRISIHRPAEEIDPPDSDPDPPPSPTFKFFELPLGQDHKLLEYDYPQGQPPPAWILRADAGAEWTKDTEKTNGAQVRLESLDKRGVCAVEHPLPEAPWKLSGSAQFVRSQNPERRRLAVVIGFESGGIALEQLSSKGEVEVAARRVSAEGGSGWPRIEGASTLFAGDNLALKDYDTRTPVEFSIEWNGQTLSMEWKLGRPKDAKPVRIDLDCASLGLEGPARTVGVALETADAKVLDLLLARPK